MNHIDRSSDNWYQGADSEETCTDPDIHFDEESNEVEYLNKKYTDADLVKLLWAVFDLKTDEFRIIRYRIIAPHYSLEDIANHESEVKASIFKKIRGLCDKHPVFKVMFSKYKLQ